MKRNIDECNISLSDCIPSEKISKKLDINDIFLEARLLENGIDVIKKGKYVYANDRFICYDFILKSVDNENFFYGNYDSSKGFLDGKFVSSNGKELEGIFHQLDGKNFLLKGSIKYTNGNTEIGDFHIVNGRERLKKGKHIKSNGTIEDGIFEIIEDKMYMNKGRITYASGTITEGNYAVYNNIFHLVDGKFQTPSCVIFEGKFECTNYKLTFLSGKITQNGVIYEGEFNKMILNGKGSITYSNGTVIKGIFDNGKLRQPEGYVIHIHKLH